MVDNPPEVTAASSSPIPSKLIKVNGRISDKEVFQVTLFLQALDFLRI